MTSDNDKTLEAYNKHIKKYVADNKPTTQGTLKDWIDRVLRLIPNDGKILELGSGYGRDADYMESRGYKVSRTDAAESFVDLLRSQGHKAEKLNALTDDFGSDYDLVFAQAVFPHFKPDELKLVLQKCFDCLKASGTLAFSVKEGEGEGWPDDYFHVPRYFCFWKEPGLRKITEEAGFSKVAIETRYGSRDEWLHVIAEK